MNDFYKQPKILVWIETILLLLAGLLLALVIIQKGEAQPLFYLTIILYVPISQFLFTPIYKLTGGYTYYSPMLLGYMANDKQIDLHSGTNFDYLFVMTKHKPIATWKNKLLLYQLEGLLQLITLIETKRIPETVNIVGTSYFFNHRTLNKLGFRLEEASSFYRINLYLNCIDIVWMYSLTRGKLAIPALGNVKKASIQGSNLVAQKQALESLYGKLNGKQAVV
jgi:hypothetical protein